jgi:hypothetical protein
MPTTLIQINPINIKRNNVSYLQILELHLNKITDKLLKIVSKILVLQCLYKQKQDQEKMKLKN